MLARSLRLALAALSTLATLALGGCFNAPKPNCAFLCGDQNACPDEYQCSSADGRCHLLVNGAPAMCEDTLADGSIIDSSVPDGRMIDGSVDARPIDGSVDARPIDATVDAFVNHAPVLGNVSTPVNVVAGAAVSITVTATDPDTSQTLTFMAPATGTNRSPYATNPVDPTDAVGGSFNTSTHVFSMPAGILGRFDVTFSVSDGTASDTAPVVINVGASPVHINEVQVGTTAATRNLEIVNSGANNVDLSNWSVVANTTSFTIPVGLTLMPGELLTLHADTGTDDGNNLFSVAALNTVVTANEVALYQTATVANFDKSHFMRDFVKFGAGTGRVDQAVFAGQWPTTGAGDFVDTSTMTDPETMSIARSGTQENKAAWYIEDTPSFGFVNVP